MLLYKCQKNFTALNFRSKESKNTPLKARVKYGLKAYTKIKEMFLLPDVWKTKANFPIIGNDSIIGNSNFNHLSHLNLLKKKQKFVIFKMNKCHSYQSDANLCFENSLLKNLLF